MTGSGARLAVIAEYDPIWCLATWERTLPRLTAAGHEIRGLVLCPPRFGPIPPEDVGRWYRDTFGAGAARCLAFYTKVALRSRALRARLGIRTPSFEALAETWGIELHYASGPNDPGFRDWLAHEAVDVLLINIGHIVGRATLAVPRLGTLNLHDSLLPANKGVLPYLRARIGGTPQGVTVHDVEAEIDAGAIRSQLRLAPGRHCSLIAYQHRVIEHYPALVGEAVARLIRGETLQPPGDVAASYFGLPTPDDAEAYRRAGGRVTRVADILRGALL